MKEKYEIFKYIFEKEEKRRDELTGRIKIYLSILTFYLGVLAFNLKEVQEVLQDTGLSVKVLWVITLVALVVPLFFIVRTLTLQYQGMSGLDDLIQSDEVSNTNASEFYLARMVDLADVHDQNIVTNDRVSRDLAISTVFLSIGIATSFALFVFIIV